VTKSVSTQSAQRRGEVAEEILLFKWILGALPLLRALCVKRV
jgi:hypothetical protein